MIHIQAGTRVRIRNYPQLVGTVVQGLPDYHDDHSAEQYTTRGDKISNYVHVRWDNGTPTSTLIEPHKLEVSDAVDKPSD
jgi:hypothetical protein